MPTAPLSQTLVDNLAGKTAWRFEGTVGEVFSPVFMCCSSPNQLGITEGKSPVARISLSPNPAFVNETVQYNSGSSYDPDGSITAQAWTFESQTPTSSSESASSFAPAASGVFTITLIVTDGTNLKSHPARVELVVERPDFTDGNPYVSSCGGVFYGSTSGSVVTWTDKNVGASGGALAAYKTIIDPATQHLAEGSKTLWKVTASGVYVSNNGGDSWAEKSPSSVSNQWSDSPAPSPADLEFVDLVFAGSLLVSGGRWYSDAASAYRSWLFHTPDFNKMRNDTSCNVAWTEITTTWEA